MPEEGLDPPTRGFGVRGVRDPAAVPRISEFYGIVIAMYYGEHGVPHFHATYSGETVVVAIETGEALAGSVPDRALRLVQEWVDLHRAELMDNWERAREQVPLERVAPLP